MRRLRDPSLDAQDDKGGYAQDDKIASQEEARRDDSKEHSAWFAYAALFFFSRMLQA